MGDTGEVVHHHSQTTPYSSSSSSASASASASASGVSVVPQLSDSYGRHGFCYGAGKFYYHLPVMPLRSDTIESLDRPQATYAPKMEDCFGGNALTMGAHDHHNTNKEAMALLSLDSMCYSTHEADTQHSLKNFQEIPIQENQCRYPYSNFSTDIRIHHEETHRSSHSPLHLPAEMKNWVIGNYDYDPEVTDALSVRTGAYGEFQHSSSLSMSPGSQSSCVTGSSALMEVVRLEAKKRGHEVVEQKHIVHRKSIDTFGQRTSQYRGVTRHRWTGRYEAHLWDNSYQKEGQSRKGRQVYLGGYDMEEKAARAYDLAAIKYWGPSTRTNFAVESYQKEMEDMKNMSRQEHVAHLRRRSSGFSRGASMFRGVTRHHQHGRWQARIGRVADNKDLYLGTFGTQEEAAEAYDIAAIRLRGTNAVTNFDIKRYNVERIMSSNSVLSGELARKISSDLVGLDNCRLADNGGQNANATATANAIVNSLSSSRDRSLDGVLSFPVFSTIYQLAGSKMLRPNVVGTTSSLTNANTELMPMAMALAEMPVFAFWGADS